MTNIKFNYLYRDAGNHKVWGSEVFLNSGSLSLNVIDESIKHSLIDGQFFNPKYWKVKRLDFGDWDAEIDHAWNEFESIEITNDEPTIGYSVTEFLEIISMAPKY
jgi:hypothetical protein